MINCIRDTIDWSCLYTLFRPSLRSSVVSVAVHVSTFQLMAIDNITFLIRMHCYTCVEFGSLVGNVAKLYLYFEVTATSAKRRNSTLLILDTTAKWGVLTYPIGSTNILAPNLTCAMQALARLRTSPALLKCVFRTCALYNDCLATSLLVSTFSATELVRCS